MRHVRWGLVLLIMLALCGDADAVPRVRRSCALAWDAVTTDVESQPATPTSYRVYTSTTSGSYGAATLTVDGAVTQATCRALGLVTHNQTYYVVVTAVNADGVDSALSNEVVLTITAGVVLVR